MESESSWVQNNVMYWSSRLVGLNAFRLSRFDCGCLAHQDSTVSLGSECSAETKLEHMVVVGQVQKCSGYEVFRLSRFRCVAVDCRAETKSEQIVVVGQVLAADVNIGYESIVNTQVSRGLRSLCVLSTAMSVN